MKAVLCKKYGPPDVLQLANMEKPVPKAGEILVKNHATTVSVADRRIRAFDVPPSFWVPGRLALGLLKPRNPILGREFAGEVEEVGQHVQEFNKGDLVIACAGGLGTGSYAEYICLNPGDKDLAVTAMPENMNFAESAAIPLGGLTALHFARKANIQKGQKVLVYGASGSVGTYAVQLAKYFGAGVTGVCSTTNLELVQSLGADKVLDYTTGNFSLGNEAYDVIFDAVGKARMKDCMKALKKKGVFLHAVSTPGVSLRMALLAKPKGIKTVGGGPKVNAEDLLFLKKLVEKGQLKPVIDRSYPLEQIVEAHAYVDRGHKKGNVAILI
jgi:NADPH:quinone reductase-like Zn-dependent oxidoreductase